MSPEEPSMEWKAITERATNQLFFYELVKGKYPTYYIHSWHLL